MANGNDPFLLRPGGISKTFAIRMSLSYTVVEYRLFPIFFDAKSDWHQPTGPINIIYTYNIQMIYRDRPRVWHFSRLVTLFCGGFLGHKFHTRLEDSGRVNQGSLSWHVNQPHPPNIPLAPEIRSAIKVLLTIGVPLIRPAIKPLFCFGGYVREGLVDEPTKDPPLA